MSSPITIAHYFDPYEARIVQGFLEAHDIYAFIPEWHHATQAWHHTFALPGVRLCVLAKDVEGARELLATARNGSDATARRTPPCDSSQHWWRRLLSIFLWWWSGIPTPYWRRNFYKRAAQEPRTSSS